MILLAAAALFTQQAIDAQIEQLDIVTRAEFEARMARVEEIADATSDCVRESFVLAAADLGSTAAAIRFCPDCKEANPAGFSVEARMALKIGALGFQIDQCYRAAKKGKQPSSVIKWANRIITGGFAALNTASAIRGEPILRWGVK